MTLEEKEDEGKVERYHNFFKKQLGGMAVKYRENKRKCNRK